MYNLPIQNNLAFPIILDLSEQLLSLLGISSPFLNLDGTPLCDPVLGHGGTGVVVQRDGIAVKLPLRYIDDNDDDTQANCLVIKHEEDVYQQPQDSDGVERCFSFSGYFIQMKLMKNRDLATYLKRQRSSCDFTESSILSLDSGMERVDDHGYSIYTDIGQLGAVIYEIITGQHCRFDLFKGQSSGPACAVWPRQEILSFTKNVWLDSSFLTRWAYSWAM
ncbi:hypothetical protein AJ78_01164 [Emergomyces pasteurianus Ep9510]|uniref:Protein kinase domain-containing protein n=1 Tax=Emergomyces pasteurianus Ep9510 TaxID=1447872 RepID=A0A1J9PQU3_9EURO|nr:hypothetical protein AJ78_01164 [Emergomyces pasteurianus Ep9510]